MKAKHPSPHTGPYRMLRCRQDHPDFVRLVQLLDRELAERDGAEHAYYAQFNGIEALDQVVLAFVGENAIGCGAFKPFDADAVEIKRMYVTLEHRGKGVAQHLLKALEAWAGESGFERCVLETGSRQTEAIRLYTKAGYGRIENYGPYLGVDNSRCFEKRLHAANSNSGLRS